MMDDGTPVEYIPGSAADQAEQYTLEYLKQYFNEWNTNEPIDKDLLLYVSENGQIEGCCEDDGPFYKKGKVDHILQAALDQYGLNRVPDKLLNAVFGRAKAKMMSISGAQKFYGGENPNKMLFQLGWRLAKNMQVFNSLKSESGEREYTFEFSKSGKVISLGRRTSKKSKKPSFQKSNTLNNGSVFEFSGSDNVRYSEPHMPITAKDFDSEDSNIFNDESDFEILGFDDVVARSQIYACLLSLLDENTFPMNRINAIVFDPVQLQVYHHMINEYLKSASESGVESGSESDNVRLPMKDFEAIRESFRGINVFFESDYYQFLQKTILGTIDFEVERLSGEKNGRDKIDQLNTVKSEIMQLMFDDMKEIKQPERIPGIKDAFQENLCTRLKDIAGRDTINKKRNKIRHFLKALLGVLITAVGIFLPLISTTYRHRLFRSHTSFEIEKAADNLARNRCSL